MKRSILFVVLLGTFFSGVLWAQSLTERIEEIVYLYYDAYGRDASPAVIRAGRDKVEGLLVDGWTIDEIEQLVWRILNEVPEAGTENFEALVATEVAAWGKPGPGGWTKDSQVSGTVPPDEPSAKKKRGNRGKKKGKAEPAPTPEEGSPAPETPTEPPAETPTEEPIWDQGNRTRGAGESDEPIWDQGNRGQEEDGGQDEPIWDQGNRTRGGGESGEPIWDQGNRSLESGKAVLATVDQIGPWSLELLRNLPSVMGELPQEPYKGRTRDIKSKILEDVDSDRPGRLVKAAAGLSGYHDDLSYALLAQIHDKLIEIGSVGDRIDFLRVLEDRPSPRRMRLVCIELVRNDHEELAHTARVILSKDGDGRFAPAAIAAILNNDPKVKREGGRLLKVWAESSMLPMLQDLMAFGDPIAQPYIMAAVKRAESK